jgi:hypothetical protein
MKWDVFISHASEDKESIARPLANLLAQAGLTVWLDENELELGDDLGSKIDNGLSESRYGVVILSKAFFLKNWTQRELNGLVARESASQKVVLPIWHEVDHTFVARYSPTLAGKLAVSSNRGLQHVASKIVQVVRSEHDLSQTVLFDYDNPELINEDILRSKLATGDTNKLTTKDLRLGLTWGIFVEDSGSVKFSERFIQVLCKESHDWVMERPKSRFSEKEWLDFRIVVIANGTSESARPIHIDDLTYFVRRILLLLLDHFLGVCKKAQIIEILPGEELHLAKEFKDEVYSTLILRAEEVTGIRKVKPLVIRIIADVARAHFLLYNNEKRDHCYFVAVFLAYLPFFKDLIEQIENLFRKGRKRNRP